MYKIPKNLTTFLFDMDGTLVDTEPVGPELFENIFHTYGVNLTSPEKELFSKTWRREGTDIKTEDYLYELTEKYAISKQPLDIVHEFYSRYKIEIIKARELPGASDFLKASRGSGRKLALVTSSKRIQADAILRFHKWMDYFDLVISEEDITFFKPNPEPYILTAQKLSVGPSDCIVFEDAKNGVDAGKAAGMMVVGLRAGNKIQQDLSNADIVMNTLSEVRV
jgi:beta-phosphoglucomutase